MISKIFLVFFTVCIAQILGESSGDNSKKISLNELRKIASKNFSSEFLEAHKELDDFPAKFLLLPLKIVIAKKDPHFVTCYDEWGVRYKNLVRKFTDLTRQTADDLNFYFKEQPHQCKRAQLNLKKMSNIMKKYQSGIEAAIKSQKYEKTIELMKKTKLYFMFHYLSFIAEMKKFRRNQENYENKAEKAEKQFKKIRDDARKESKGFIEKMLMCIKNIKNDDNPFAPPDTFYRPVEHLE